MALKDRPDDELIVRYLLGEELPDEDIDHVEERYFKDDQYFEDLGAVEDDLIDAYLRGKLSPVQAAAFEHHFLAVPRRREKLEAHRAIASFFRSTPPAPPLLAELRRVLRGQTLMVRFAAAALGLAIVAGMGISTIGYFHVNREFKQLQSRVAIQEHQGPAIPTVATFILDPGAVRSTGGNRIRLNAASEWVVIQLRLLPSAPDSAYYVAALTLADGEELWRQSRISQKGAIVEIRLPAALLSRGDYIISLAAMSGGALVALPSYVFQVEN